MLFPIFLMPMPCLNFEIFLHKRELKGILQLAPVYLKIFHENYLELMTDDE
jgi:hypothetical protein